MDLVQSAETEKFTDASIEEVDTVASPAYLQIDEQVSVIESFSQPFPTRAHNKPVMSGEMDSYG